MLTDMAILAARYRGLQDFRLILRRTRATISVQLMRRAVAMVRACIPRDAELFDHLVLQEDETIAMWPRTRAVEIVDGFAHCNGNYLWSPASLKAVQRCALSARQAA